MKAEEFWEHREVGKPPWREKFIRAVGSSIGTPGQRASFADRIVSDLPAAIMWGRRVESFPGDVTRLKRIAVQARDSFAELKRAVEDEPTLESDALHLCAESTVGFRQLDFAAIARYLEAFAGFAEELASEPPRRRRGPPDGFALTVCTAVAIAYWESFAQWPGGGKRWKNARETPYHRVCDVVEEVLANHRNAGRYVKGVWRPITLSDICRKKAVTNARETIKRRAQSLREKASLDLSNASPKLRTRSNQLPA